MYTVSMLPAEYGDCLWIEYGDSSRPKRILIDAGTPKAYPALRSRIEALPAEDRVFELLVVTHIDIDHIGGVLPLLADAPRLGVTFKEIWFNGYSHVEAASDLLGGLEGEKLSALIVTLRIPWNARFDGKMIAIAEDSSLPTVDVSGMTVTMLSPTIQRLGNLADEWKETVEAAGLVPGIEERLAPEEEDDLLGDIDVDVMAESVFRSDNKKPNGSSIAFVAQYGNRGVLFGADAFPRLLTESIGRMSASDVEKIRVLKIPHHGSRANLDNGLLGALGSHTFLVSTNGKRFKHPHPESIARIIHRGDAPRILFNYRSDFNQMWENLDTPYKYDVGYGDKNGVTVDVTKT